MKRWDLVFEDLWFYKYLSTYSGRKRIHFSTPINSVKLESAILYMVDKINTDMLICNDVYKGIYTTNSIHDALYFMNSFYEPFNYKNYVHLNIVHDPSNYENLVHLDKVLDLINYKNDVHLDKVH